MEKDKWGIFSLQLAIVYKEQPSDDDFKEMPGDLKGVFDGAPTMFPVPSDAPTEIPRVMISSSDRFKIEVSKERVSLFFQNDMDGSRTSINDSKEQLIKKAEEIYLILKLETKIKWIGVILNSFNINDDPNTAMRALFTDKARTLVSSENKNDFVFDYSERKTHELGSVQYPGRLVMQIGSRLTKHGEQVGNSMIYDINTKDTINGTYTIDTIKALINKAFEEQEVVFDGLV